LKLFESASILFTSPYNFGESRGGHNQPQDPEPAGKTDMKILCAVNQAECFRRGIDAPASTIKIEVNPAKLPEELRAFVADNLADGHRLSMRDEFYLRRPDLIGFMEAILVAKDFSESNEDKDPFLSFSERMKEVDAGAKDKWEKRASELAKAQEQPEGLDDLDASLARKYQRQPKLGNVSRND
jgi:hypothetical protein